MPALPAGVAAEQRLGLKVGDSSLSWSLKQCDANAALEGSSRGRGLARCAVFPCVARGKMKNTEKKWLEHAGAARGEHTIGTAFHTILGGTLVRSRRIVYVSHVGMITFKQTKVGVYESHTDGSWSRVVGTRPGSVVRWPERPRGFVWVSCARRVQPPARAPQRWRLGRALEPTGPMPNTMRDVVGGEEQVAGVAGGLRACGS